MRFIRCLTLLGGLAGLTLSLPAAAIFIGNSQGGAEFPAGTISFADAVEEYSLGIGGATAANTEPSNALGLPDYVSGGACAGDPADCTFVSLGAGGSLTLRFEDNVLTGSGNTDLDLWIFEVGPDVEATMVEVSTDGVVWESVGSVGGSVSGIDLDAAGFGIDSLFSLVRLTDVAGEGGTSGDSVGADIDAVGAISTRPAATVPEPGVVALLGLGLLGLVLTRSRRI